VEVKKSVPIVSCISFCLFGMSKAHEIFGFFLCFDSFIFIYFFAFSKNNNNNNNRSPALDGNYEEKYKNNHNNNNSNSNTETKNHPKNENNPDKNIKNSRNEENDSRNHNNHPYIPTVWDRLEMHLANGAIKEVLYGTKWNETEVLTEQECRTLLHQHRMGMDQPALSIYVIGAYDRSYYYLPVQRMVSSTIMPAITTTTTTTDHQQRRSSRITSKTNTNDNSSSNHNNNLKPKKKKVTYQTCSEQLHDENDYAIQQLFKCIPNNIYRFHPLDLAMAHIPKSNHGGVMDKYTQHLLQTITVRLCMIYFMCDWPGCQTF
jgi:hypothetical protein